MFSYILGTDDDFPNLLLSVNFSFWAQLSSEYTKLSYSSHSVRAIIMS